MAEDKRIKTTVGRLINGSLFDKDVFKDEKGREGTPSYKIEMAFDGDDAIAELEQAIVEAAVAKWGKKAEKDYDDGKIRSPILIGDDLAKARVEKGKKGDAYAGKLIIRASTQFNKNGDDAPGGVYVCDENAAEVDFANRGKVYNGSYGVAVVTPTAYDGVGGGPDGVTLYLQGYQFVKDGERLRGAGASDLFKPMLSEGSEAKGRRKRGS